MKARRNGSIVLVAVIVCVNRDDRREILGLEIGPSNAETSCTGFQRKVVRRGLRGVKPVISDAHESIKAAVAKVLNATWQRRRVHFMRNVLAHAGRKTAGSSPPSSLLHSPRTTRKPRADSGAGSTQNDGRVFRTAKGPSQA